jgi:hypothetical protein
MIHRRRKFAFRTGTVLMFATVILLPASAAFADPVNPTPSTDGMPGAALWNQVLGWMMQWGLWLSLAAIVLGAGGWWVSASTGSYGGASKGKQFVFGGAIGALIIGLGPTMVNLLFSAGQGG